MAVHSDRNDQHCRTTTAQAARCCAQAILDTWHIRSMVLPAATSTGRLKNDILHFVLYGLKDTVLAAYVKQVNKQLIDTPTNNQLIDTLVTSRCL